MSETSETKRGPARPKKNKVDDNRKEGDLIQFISLNGSRVQHSPIDKINQHSVIEKETKDSKEEGSDKIDEGKIINVQIKESGEILTTEKVAIDITRVRDKTTQRLLNFPNEDGTKLLTDMDSEIDSQESVLLDNTSLENDLCRIKVRLIELETSFETSKIEM